MSTTTPTATGTPLAARIDALPGTGSGSSSTSAASRSPPRCSATRSARRSPTSSTAGASARRSTWRATASATAATATSTTRCRARSRELRSAFYGHLAPIANEWSALLGGDADAFPLEHDELLERCRAAGQERPTPLILRYGEGDWNALHQDLYGDVYFPFQVLTVLSEPRVDYEGGEFVLLEQRPRAQSRAHVVPAPRGAFVVFPTHHRPQQGARGYYKVGLRHGVSTISRGSRTALGIIFHDAR